MRIDHIGIIVRNVDFEAKWFFAPWKLKIEEREYDNGLKLRLGKGYRLELIEILDGYFPYAKVGFHHIGYRGKETKICGPKIYEIIRPHRKLMFFDTIKEKGYLTELMEDY